MIFFSESLVLSRPATIESHFPVICYDSQVTVSSVAADEEDADYPASNLANVSTVQLWKSGSTADGDIAVTLPGNLVDYLAIARHNFGSGLCGVSIWGTNSEPGAVSVELIPEQFPGDDSPLIFFFDEDYFVELLVKLTPGTVEPQAAVLFAGKKLAMSTGLQPGYTPTPDAADVEATSGRARSGDYLGTIVTSESNDNEAAFRDLDPDWYRTYFRPFVDVAKTGPFFFAWSPTLYPSEVAYAWATVVPRPSIRQTTGEMDVTMSMGAVTS